MRGLGCSADRSVREKLIRAISYLCVSQDKSLEIYVSKSPQKANQKKFNYKKPARLVWQDISKMTTGVGYLRGQPDFEGTLVEAIRKYDELPSSSQAFAHIYVDPQSGPKNPETLHAKAIEAVRKRKDFPKR